MGPQPMMTPRPPMPAVPSRAPAPPPAPAPSWTPESVPLEERMSAAFGGFGGLQSALGVARHESPGTPDPRLAHLTPEQLALLDRYSHGGLAGQQGGITGLPGTALLAAGYEGTKKLAPVAHFLEAAFGPQFHVDQTTSPPSMQNVEALMRGYMTGMMR